MKKAIGFNRFIRRAWLDQTARLRDENKDVSQLRAALHTMLHGRVAGESARGARTKSVGVLVRIWSPSDVALAAERDSALRLMKGMPSSQWLVFHWFLVCATYPFFEDVAVHVGRLLKLQNEVSAKEIMERLSKAYGERETVLRCLQYVLRSMVEWGVLDDVHRGSYGAGRKAAIEQGQVLGWTIRCRLVGRNADGLYESALKQDPAAFPFLVEEGAWKEMHDMDGAVQGRDVLYRQTHAGE